MKSLFIVLALIAFTNAQANGNQSLLSNSIPYPYYDVHKTSEGKTNYLTVLNSGIVSLQARIDMIRNAQHRIEVEYFIYALDQSSKLFTLELIKAAERGVKVRVLVDKSGTVFQLDEYYAKALKEKGVEVRYYNAAPLIRFSSINFRNHRKLISVDDKVAITGGRNIGDDYFDLSPEYNFVDRDVIVEGPMVKTMRESFDKFYDSEITEHPTYPSRPADRVTQGTGDSHAERMTWVDNTSNVKKYLKRISEARAFVTQTQANTYLLDKVERIAKPLVADKEKHLCPELTYSTDAHGGNFFTRLFDRYSDEYRFLRKTLHDKTYNTNHKLFLSSPYILNNGKTRKLMSHLLENDVEITMLTNSLASTDAIYIAANLYKDIFRWARMGMKTYIHAGTFYERNEILNESIASARWGTHSKTQIYDSIDENGNLISEVMIGTYNIDNRSNHYNTEMAIFCKGSDSYTEEVRESANHRLDNAYRVHGNQTAYNANGERVSIFGDKAENKLLTALIAMPSWLLKFLL